MNDYFDALLVGKRFAEERERLGLTKVGVAEACGIRREMVGRYEKGEATPGSEVLAKLIVLGADVTYILTGVRTSAPAGGGVYIADPRKLALLDNYEHATEEGQRAIERVALLESEAQHREVKTGRKRSAASREAA